MRVLARALLAVALWLCCSTALAAVITIRSDGHPPRTFGPSPYQFDVTFDFDGDTQRQVDPRTCADPAAVDLSTCGNAETAAINNDPTVGDGWTKSISDCSTSFECINPADGKNRCGDKSPSCDGANWVENGLNRLTGQVRTHLGMDRGAPQRAAFVVQVGDNIDEGQYCNLLRRDDVCAPDGSMREPCYLSIYGFNAGPKVKAEIYTQNTKFIDYYLKPLLEAGMPTAVANGNHDHIGCWESRIKPLLIAQPQFVAQAADATNLDTATMYSLKVRTVLGNWCIVVTPFVVYSQTAAAGNPLKGCGAGLPTIMVGHAAQILTGPTAFYWQTPKGDTNAATQMVDQLGHPEVWLNMRGHILPEGFTFTGSSAINNNTNADIWDIRSNFQWSAQDGIGNAPFGGLKYDGISALDGTGGEVVRCTVSPARQRFWCVPYNPPTQKFGAWDFTSTGYTGINGGTVVLDWCTRFGC